MQETKPNYKRAALNGLKLSLQTAKKFLIIVVPCVLVIQTLEYFELIGVIAQWFSPLMALFRMPGEAVLVIVSGFFSTASGIAAGVALGLTPRELTLAFVFMGCCHNLVVESAMVKGAKASASLVIANRFIGAVLATLIASRLI